jgi:small subunit ribosomal protein S4
MGDPKFLRRLYDTPKHPWEATRMEQERKLLEKYGLKNKRELWKAQSTLRGFRRQARELQARVRAGEPQARHEMEGLLGRLTRLGVLPMGSPALDDVLALSVDDVLTRRFEWVVFTKGLAPTPWGARQLIVHGHLSIGDHKVTRPGYMVLATEVASIAYSPASPLQNEEHPIRLALREKVQSQASSAPPPSAPPSPAGPPGPGGP